MRGVLRAESLWVETFTGLRTDRFERLLRVVRERGGNVPVAAVRGVCRWPSECCW
jgi:hypothetical protein